MSRQKETNQLSQKSVARGLWIAEHRANLRRGGLTVLLLITVSCVLLLLYSIWQWMSHISSTNQIVAEIAAGQTIMNRPSPAAVTVDQTEVVRYDDQTVDLVTRLTNPNNNWAATLVPYRVTVAGQVVTTQTNLRLAPSQSWVIVANRVPWTGTDLPTVEVEVGETAWQRWTDSSKLPTPDWVPDAVEYGAVFSTPDTAVYRTQLRFALNNRTEYDLAGVNPVVLLRNASGALVGVGSITLDNVASQASVPLRFYWPLSLPADATAEVIVNTQLLPESM